MFTVSSRPRSLGSDRPVAASTKGYGSPVTVAPSPSPTLTISMPSSASVAGPHSRSSSFSARYSTDASSPRPRGVVDDLGHALERREGGVELVGHLLGRPALAFGDLFFGRVRPRLPGSHVRGRSHHVAGDVADSPAFTPARRVPLLLVQRPQE